MAKTKAGKGKSGTGRRAHHSGRLELRGKKWLAVWMIAGKRFSQSTGLEDRAEAEKWLARKLEAITTGDGLRKLGKDEEYIRQVQRTVLKDALDETDKQRAELLEASDKTALRFDEAWEAFRTSPKLGDLPTPQTMRYTETKFNRLRKWIAERHPEVLELRQVTQEMAEEFAADIKPELGQSAYNGVLDVNCRIWKILAAKIKSPVNPWIKEEIPRLGRQKAQRRELSNAELDAIFSTARREAPDFADLFTVMLFTGLRLGDAAQLKWQDIHLADGFIYTMPQKTARFDKWVYIPILAPLRAMLESRPAAARDGYVLPELAARYQRYGCELSNAICRFLREKCGMETSVDAGKGRRRRPVVGPHSFRHCFVSRAMNAGISPAMVRQVVGHTSQRMSERYTHPEIVALLRAFAAFPVQRVPAIGQGETIDAEAHVIQDEADGGRAARLAALDTALEAIAKDGDAGEVEAALEKLDEFAEKLRRAAK